MRWLILASMLVAPTAPAGVRTESFRSQSLDREVRYVVDLPPSYATGNRRYPVVYALHGLFEDSSFWEARGLAAQLAQQREAGALPDFIVVAVDGGNSFFVNHAGGRFQDLVTRDLVEHVDTTYRTIARRDARGLWGVSMGGYGALRIALAEPDRFAAVVTHSAMILTKPPTAADGAGRYQMTAFNRVFGEPIDPVLWAANDPLALAEKADPQRVPALSIDCGAQDRYGLAAGHRELERRLRARGIEARVETPPGDHGYEYVRTVFAKGMAFLGERLADR
ncbi:MAG TPA: alpha/beta fold hydrolase [Vicinamibacteria bacterium]|nr:alpha/beta fold hydrolase [Vicinamibacteria bacterium]